MLCYEQWLEEIAEKIYPEECYSIAEELIGNENYSEDEIQEFCRKLDRYVGQENFSKTGLFISALINSNKEKEVNIYLDNKVGEKLNYLGYENAKNLRIVGNTGKYLGENMKEGRIIVEGNIGKLGTPMGGEIYQRKELIYPGKLRMIFRRICSLKFGRR